MATGTAEQIEQAQQTTALATTTGALTAFAPDPERVKALAAQFIMTLTYKGHEKLTYDERIALAAASIAYGLSPAIGEIWMLHDQGMFVGIGGWVKKFNEFADKHEFRWRYNEHRLYKQDFEAEGIPDNAKIAYRVTVRRSDFDEFYSQRAIDLAKAGFSYEQCLEILGPPPIFTGIGWIGANETLSNDGKGASQSPGQKAIKRALKDAIAKFVHLPFAGEGDRLASGETVDTDAVFVSRTSGGDTEPDPTPTPTNPAPADDGVVDGEIVETTPVAASVSPQGDSDADRILGKGNVFKRPLNADSVKRTLAVKVKKSDLTGPCTPKQAGWIASLMNKAFKDSATADKDRYSVMSWLFEREVTTTRDLSSAEASAVIDWLADETQDLGQDGAIEIQNVYVEAMKAAGQTDMFDAPAELPAA